MSGIEKIKSYGRQAAKFLASTYDNSYVKMIVGFALLVYEYINESFASSLN